MKGTLPKADLLIQSKRIGASGWRRGYETNDVVGRTDVINQDGNVLIKGATDHFLSMITASGWYRAPAESLEDMYKRLFQ